MSDKVPPWNRPCTTYEWCHGSHTSPAEPHVKNLDLIEHLDNRDCLIDVNIVAGGDEKIVQVLFTNMDGIERSIELAIEDAWTLGDIIHLFDRRGMREFGQLLKDGAEILQSDDQ